MLITHVNHYFAEKFIYFDKVEDYVQINLEIVGKLPGLLEHVCALHVISGKPVCCKHMKSMLYKVFCFFLPNNKSCFRN